MIDTKQLEDAHPSPITVWTGGHHGFDTYPHSLSTSFNGVHTQIWLHSPRVLKPRHPIRFTLACQSWHMSSMGQHGRPAQSTTTCSQESDFRSHHLVPQDCFFDFRCDQIELLKRRKNSKTPWFIIFPINELAVLEPSLFWGTPKYVRCNCHYMVIKCFSQATWGP